MEKTFKINFEEKNYDCKMESNDDQNINITLANECLQKFNGNISLKNIYEKLLVFEDYTMKEFFSVLEDLKDEKFQIKKEKNKYKLNILIKVLNKEKILNIYRYNRSYSI